MIRRLGIPFTCAGIMFLLIFFPAQTAQGASRALNAWFVTVLPCLAPFFFLSALIVTYLPRKKGFFNIWQAYTFVAGMSALSGYPMNARLCASLHSEKLLSREGAIRLACVASVTGPAFFVSAVSTSMLGSSGFFVYLLPAHYLSSIMIMTVTQCLRPVHLHPCPSKKTDTPPLGRSMLDATTGSCAALLNICIFMVAFGAFLSVIDGIIPAFSLFSGLFEMTTGCFFISELFISLELKLVLISFICSFAGLAIHAQSHSLFSECGLRLKHFFMAKLSQGLLSALLTFLLLKVIPTATANTP